MDKFLPNWFTRLYSQITDYSQEIIDPVAKIKVEIHVKNLFGTFLASVIGITGLHLVLPMNIQTNLFLTIAQVCCSFGILRLYHKKPQHLGNLLCVICISVNFVGTYFDEKMMFCGLGFSIVVPNFLIFLSNSKQMAFVGFMYTVLLNMAIGPKFYEMILRESGNQDLANLLDSSRATLNVFTFYAFAFIVLEDSRFNKILNTLAVTLKAEEHIKQEKELLNSKSLFFSCFSHEMRNPLNCILGSMDYAIKYASDDVIRDILATGKACGSLLVNLINNILDMGKLDSNNICLNEDMRDSKQFITNTWRVTQELFKKKKQVGEIFVDRDFPSMIQVDDTRLSQVIVNLISNACKFTGEGKTVRVVFSFDKTDINQDANLLAPSVDLPQYIQYAELNGNTKVDRESLKSTQKLSNITPIYLDNSPRWITSIEDDHVEKSSLDKLVDTRSKKTLHHVKVKSQMPVPVPTQNRYVLLFTTSRETIRELSDWNSHKEKNVLIKSEKGIIKIEVIDSGCGMTEEEVGKLFKPFIQANKTITGTYGGTGLGLYITQSLTKLMRGTISVESQVHKGSTFTVSIPNDPVLSSELCSTDKLVKSLSPFSRFNIVLCCNRTQTNSSWTELVEFEEKLKSLCYHLEHVNHFVSPQTHKSPAAILKTYFVYDASYLTEQNISVLKTINMKDYENNIFVFNSDDTQIQPTSALPATIIQLSDSEVLADEIQNHTKEMLYTLKSKYSILIVDDDDFNRKIMSVFLTKEGYKVFTANNGQVGYEMYCKHTDDISLVVVDYEMPICDGPTCAEKILKYITEQNMTPVPIYGLTGNVSQESKARIADAGIKKAWNKPAKLEEIMDEIFYVVTK